MHVPSTGFSKQAFRASKAAKGLRATTLTSSARRRSGLGGSSVRAIRNANASPETAPILDTKLPLLFGLPDCVLISAGDFPGNVIAGCRLLRSDRGPGANLTRDIISAGIFQRRARSVAVIKEKMTSSLGKPGRSIRLDHDCGRADLSVAVQVLVETRFARFERKCVPRDSADTRHKIAAAVGLPDYVLIGAPIFQATSYPVAVFSAAIGVQAPNWPVT